MNKRNKFRVVKSGANEVQAMKNRPKCGPKFALSIVATMMFRKQRKPYNKIAHNTIEHTISAKQAMLEGEDEIGTSIGSNDGTEEEEGGVFGVMGVC